MKKQYKLKDNVKIDELKKYGYEMLYGMFYQHWGKTVKETKTKETKIVVRDYFKTVDVYVFDKLHFDFKQTFGFGKNELLFIKDLLDANLLEACYKQKNIV